jgi:NTE family protein
MARGRTTRPRRSSTSNGDGSNGNGSHGLDSETRPLAIGVLGAGAPTSPLMAGALAYMYQKGKTFDIFFTSGGGALLGLLFVAPAGDKRPDKALRDVVEFGIDERIYRAFPVGYKTFIKQGWFTRQIHQLAGQLKADVLPRPFPGEAPPPGYDPEKQRRKRFYNDLIDFWATALTPPRIGPTSRGLCEPLPYLEGLIDFRKANTLASPSGLDFTIPIPIPWPIVLPDPIPLRGPKPGPAQMVAVPLHLGWFYVNAYNLNTKKIESLSNDEPKNPATGFPGSLSAEAIRAALSFPFIYPPQELAGAPYCEGALVDPLNLPAAIGTIADVNKAVDKSKVSKLRTGVTFYLFDVLGSLEDPLMFCPENLWEAYGLSIVTPIISLANKSKRLFEATWKPPVKLEQLKFVIPERSRRRPLEWTYANMTALWDAGWKAGETFIRDHGRDLPNRVEPPPRRS